MPSPATFNGANPVADPLAEEAPTDWILCYLVCMKDPAGGFVGGILLTDNRARPLHFAFVQPVRPTAMQRILYGSILEEHLKIDVIAHKLWEGLPNPPDVVFVNSPDLIAARRVTGGVPTALLAKLAATEANTSSLSTVRYDVGPQNRDEDLVGEIVVALEGAFDLVEPFSRVAEALKEGLRVGA